MKILFLMPRDSRRNLGGVEGHVRILREELEKRGHRVKELALDEINGLNKGPALLQQGRAFWTLGALGYKFKAWGYLWKNRDLLKWADIIHVHDVFWWIMPFAIINKGPALLQQQGRALKAKVFVTFHGWEGVCPPSWSAVWQKKLAQRLSDGTIGVGSFYEKWYGVKPDRIVWGVVDPKINKGSAFRLAKGRALRKIVFLGRLEKVNGVEVVVEAIRTFKGRAFEYKGQALGNLGNMDFLFVGDGSYRKQAEKFGKVTGMVKNPQKYLAGADLVITSSYMSMLEAAAIGKPIIAIANSELKEDYLDGHPLRKYIKVVRNADELAGAIEKVQESTRKYKKVQEVSDKAREWVVGQTPEKLADIYEELWKKYTLSFPRKRESIYIDSWSSQE